MAVSAQNEQNGNNNDDPDDNKQNDQKTDITDNDDNDTQTDDNDNKNDDIKPKDAKKVIDRFFYEPLYVGNLTLRSAGSGYYRWIIFISTSMDKIIKPITIKSVTYKLHPTFNKSHRRLKKSPFFLDINGWGVFQFAVNIKFKDEYIRSNIDTFHMLSVNKPTTLTDVSFGRRIELDKLFEYQHFNKFKYEKLMNMNGNNAKNLNLSFVKKVKERLKRNLLKTPAPVYLDGYRYRLKEFNTIFKQISLNIAYLKDVPDSIINTIGYYITFVSSIHNISSNQEVIVTNCYNCDITISSPKFNHLTVQNCDGVVIKFPYILSKCELHDCYNTTIICTGLLYTYRIDECNNIKIQFLDNMQRTDFFCFNTPNIELNTVGVQYKPKPPTIYNDDTDDHKKDIMDKYEKDILKYDDKIKYPDSLSYKVPFEKGVKERFSVRWRSKQAEPAFTWKVFKPSHTLGRRG